MCPLQQCPPTLPGLVNGCGACTAEVLGVCPESDESAISRSSGRDGPWWVSPWATVDRVAGISFSSKVPPELGWPHG